MNPSNFINPVGYEITYKGGHMHYAEWFSRSIPKKQLL
jgi:hypothetical protein